MRNQAFAFIKPHAMKSQAIATTIGDMFEDGDITVSYSCVFSAEQLAAEGLIDQHFGAVSRVALIDDVAALTVSEAGREAFAQAFGASWDAEVAGGRVVNSLEAQRRLDATPAALCSAWAKYGAIEIGRDCYVAYFEDGGFYVLNGFYPSRRNAYLTDEASVAVMLLDFEMDWHEFREAIVGSENPAAALEESIRGYLYDRAAALEIMIDSIDNVLHVSASPFAALCEKRVWLEPTIWQADSLLRALRERTGKPDAEILAWVWKKAADSASWDVFADQDTEVVAEALAIAMG